jgi:NADH-quinone oxidoreductase subunit F/NADP-reducing hydrogenase subunit HndC
MVKQQRIVLRNSGLIDPEKIDDYMERRGYEALLKSLTESTPESIIDTIEKSGLRGRGGGGFPAGLKWKAARAARPGEKFVICNADEGDPGAFMDRAVLEGDPHSVLEAMTIAGFCVGAGHGIIYIRAEYPLAIERLNTAISQSHTCGFLGDDILGTGFSFDVELKFGAGAFVCGEETSLIRSIQGSRGEPLVKPPYPADRGLWGSPTLVNNVETWANVCPIILEGADWFRSIGDDRSTGPKVFALAGKVNRVGLVEVPMGTTLRQVIFDVGGGIKDGRAFKAVQTGGPSGGCITEENLDTPVTYDNLLSIGSMMGSGGMIVLDEDDCMVNVAKFYLQFSLDESCGKCTSCRVGNTRLWEMLDDITGGRAGEGVMEKLESLGNSVRKASLCGLGQTSPNPVLSTMRYFRDEYMEHITEHKCRAGVCKALITFIIDETKCIGCTLCARNCPARCIEGKPKGLHTIVQESCVKCGNCLKACRFGAISFS